MIPRIRANASPPPIRWWGNIFYRCWASEDGLGWQQLVIVIRLPWWRYDVTPRHEQLMISWRHREGWRHGWRAA